MVYVSDFADGAVLLPIASLVAVLLGVSGWWRGLAAWVVCIGVTFGLVFVVKAGAVVVQSGFPGRPFSPSGHVAGACMVYGGLALLLLRGVAPMVFALSPSVALAVVVGYCRLGLHAHILAEVLAGAGIGLAGVAALAMLAGHRPCVGAVPAMALTACVILLCHGLHLNSELAIQHTFSAL